MRSLTNPLTGWLIHWSIIWIGTRLSDDTFVNIASHADRIFFSSLGLSLFYYLLLWSSLFYSIHIFSLLLTSWLLSLSCLLPSIYPFLFVLSFLLHLLVPPIFLFLYIPSSYHCLLHLLIVVTSSLIPFHHFSNFFSPNIPLSPSLSSLIISHRRRHSNAGDWAH